MPDAQEGDDLLHLIGRQMMSVRDRGRRLALQKVLDSDALVLGGEMHLVIEQRVDYRAAEPAGNASKPARDRSRSLSQDRPRLPEREAVLKHHLDEHAIRRQEVSGASQG